MSLRYTASKFKGLAYGPKETVQYVWSRMNGSMDRMIQEHRNCTTIEEHLKFSRNHFYPCQKASEIIAFLEWAAEKEPKTVVEIGVAMGGTTYLLANAIPSVWKVIGVDFFPRNRRALKSVIREGVRMDFVTGNSSSPETVAKVKDILGGREVDLLLIDGDHAYDAAFKDYEAYRPLVRNGGWIAFHDIRPPELKPDGSTANGFPMEVHRLWDELKENCESQEFVEDQSQFSYGIGVIQV